MKKKLTGIDKFKRFIQFVVSIIISREFAFIYCLLGTIAQIGHTYFLTSSISSLDGGWKIAQAMMLSIFISSSLLYFVAIANSEGKRKYDDGEEKIEQAIIVFTIIEIVINIYYYTRHILLDSWNKGLEPNYFDFAFACIIGILVPWTIKMYSSHIRAKEWLDNFNSEKEETPDEKIIDKQAISEQINEILDYKIKELSIDKDLTEVKEKIDDMIVDSFKNNQDKFINQFENKLKFISNKNNIELTEEDNSEKI